MSACDDADCVGSGFERVDVTYDGEGHRTAILHTPAVGTPVETTFRYAGDAIVAEYEDGTLTREYITDDAGTISKVIVPAGQTDAGTYLVTWNGHGDAMALWRIESSGALTLANSFTYGTWGEPTTATHNSIGDLGFRFLYVGEFDVQWDAELGLHYMHARHYSPSLGRFLQPDPCRCDAQLFMYVGNGPVTKVDPSGLLYVFRTFYLQRKAVRTAASNVYGLRRISYTAYSRLYNAKAIFLINWRNGRVARFLIYDVCPGAVIAGVFGISAMGTIDGLLGLASVAAAPSVLAEAVLVPIDFAAIGLTFAFVDIVQQGASKGCSDIRW